MSTAIVIAALGAAVVVLFVLRLRQSAQRRPGGSRRKGKRVATASRRRPVAPYVSASLRGVYQDEVTKPRRTSGLG